MVIAILSALPHGVVTTHRESNFIGVLILLDYFRLPSGKMVVASLRVGGIGLFNSFKVAVIIITLWGIGGFLFFKEDINKNNPCSTAFQCWMVAMNEGFRGDFGGAFADPYDIIWYTMPASTGQQGKYIDNSKGSSFMAEWGYIMLFFWIWEYLIAGIIQGQIVDAFAEIRQAQTELEEDTQDKCLLCTLDRFTIETNVESFSEHTSEEHNPWAYLYFLVTLDEMRDDLETGIESFVTGHLSSSDAAWLPVKTCFDIQNATRNEELRKVDADASMGKILEAVSDLKTEVLSRLHQQELSVARLLSEREEGARRSSRPVPPG